MQRNGSLAKSFQQLPTIASKEADLARGLAKNLGQNGSKNYIKPTDFKTSTGNNSQPSYNKYQSFRGRNKFFRSTAAKLPQYLKQWETITSDPEVLAIVKGFNIPFRQIPYQNFQPITRTPQGVQPILDMEIRNLLAKGAITQIPLSKDGYYSRIFLVPKKGGGMRPVIDLSSLNNFVENQHFQMENLSSIKTLLKQGEFMTKLDLNDAYLKDAYNSNEPSIAEVSSFHLERQSISIQSPSIWPERSASSVYQTIKTNRSIFKKTRHSSYPVFGRYANYRLLCSRDNAVYSNSDEPACLSGVHYSQGEINNNSNSNHHLSGIHLQFYYKTNKPAARESNKNLDTFPPNFDSRDGISSVACPTSWAAGVSPPSHLESSSTFSPPASTINSGLAETQPPIQRLHPRNTGFQNGINMVADKPAASKWQPNGANTSRFNNIHGCFKKGLGCDLKQRQNERQMVFSGGPVTYKSFGIERGIISGAISTEEPSPRDSQSERGQLNGCLVHQSQGRNTLPGTHPDNTRTLELVHTAGHLFGCTSCPREIKCPSRPRIKGISTRHRLEARPSSDQTLSISMQDRPLCNQTDLSTQAVHQLATRPEGCPHRCSKCELACPQGICFPSIQPAACCPKQSSGRPDRASPCCPSMASTAMVATPIKPSTSRTGASSKQEISSDKPEQPRPGPPNVPTPPSSRVSCLIQRYETEGFSKDVANLLVAATRSSTSKTYESSWHRWCGWCSQRKINPLSATLTNILSFFADCFKEGHQYRTINVLRSALSCIHPKVDNFCVGQHPYVVNILRDLE